MFGVAARAPVRSLPKMSALTRPIRSLLGSLREALSNEGIRRLEASWALGIAGDTGLLVVLLVVVFARDGIVAAGWPTADAEVAREEAVELPVQVNGKVRARLPRARGLSEEQARDAALQDENVARFVDGAKVRKIVFVPDRLINLVVG